MPDEEQMTIEERYKYLRGQQRRYRNADRVGKGRLLDEMEAVTGLHRKALVRLLQGELRRKQRRVQRGSTYTEEVRQAVLVIAESLDWVCAERLTPNLEWMARHLMRHGELSLGEAGLLELGQIGVSTVGRILARVPRERWRLPQRPPAPNPIARQVVVERIPWQTRELGHVEMDLVHHGGRSSEGDYLHTLQVVDVASGWAEQAVVAGRSYLAMTAALDLILARLPFPVLEAHSDNGSEFLNYHLIRYWQERQPAPRLSRSRPYHKNDNRFVEQKNSSLVRAYVGYGRLDSAHQARLLASLYALMHLYYNYFEPVQHQVEKSYYQDSAGHTQVRRRRDRAATPLDRAVALGQGREGSLEEGEKQRRSLNPRYLRQSIYDLVGQLRASTTTTGLGDVRRIIAAIHDQGLITIDSPKEAAPAR